MNDNGGRDVAFCLKAIALYTTVLVAFLWPWPSDPGRLGILNADLLLHAWSMAFVVRQATLDPAHLFDANMFWPQQGALAYTETLFPQSALAAPVLWLGGGPLLAHNLVLFLTIVFSGVSAAFLGRRLSGSSGAGLVSGFAFAFCAFRFHHLVQIGVASYAWFPVILLALWNLAAGRGGSANLLLLSVATLAQVLSSGYHAVLAVFVLATTLTFLARRLWSRGRLVPVGVSLLLAAGVALVAGAPSVRLRERQAVSRGVEAPIHWSAVPRSYLDPGPNVPALGLRSIVEPSPEPPFAGFAALGLAILGLRLPRHPAHRALLVAIALVSGLMAAGPVLRDLPFELPGPFELVRRVPPADMIRGPSRFGIGVILAIDMLSAIGFAAVERRMAPRSRPWLLVGLLSFMVIEMRPSLAHMVKPIPPPPAYTRTLAALPDGAVLELPWETEEGAGLQLYWSTAHWKPLISGYGGFTIPANFQLAAMARNFPTGFAARVLRCAGVRYVVIHGALVPEAQLQRALEFEPEGVRRVGRFDRDVVFELRPWEEGVECAPEIPRKFQRP